MSRPTHRWSAVAAVAGVLAIVLAQTGQSAAGERPRPGPRAPSLLTLTIADGEAPAPVERAVALRCTPPGGDHPDPVAACRTLRTVDGDFRKLEPGDGFCTLEYRPVTVTAQGVWRGTLVSYQYTFGNQCELLRATGPVFAF